MVAVRVDIAPAGTGSFLDSSGSWQLIVLTFTTPVTLLMVFTV